MSDRKRTTSSQTDDRNGNSEVGYTASPTNIVTPLGGKIVHAGRGTRLGDKTGFLEIGYMFGGWKLPATFFGSAISGRSGFLMGSGSYFFMQNAQNKNKKKFH